MPNQPQNGSSYEVKLPLFEGPFDLLLFFIQRDELDIYDIPISKVTNDFLNYIHQMELLNIELSSEFILVASTLMNIKSKLLIPRPQLDENDVEIDPREDLVRRLIEYKRYKGTLKEFEALEIEQLKKYRRQNLTTELAEMSSVQDNVENELQNINLYKILKVYRKVMDRFEVGQNKEMHEVLKFPYTVETQKTFILDLLTTKGRLSFVQLVENGVSKIEMIFNFLSILELLQSGLITLKIGEGFNNFWMKKVDMKEAS